MILVEATLQNKATTIHIEIIKIQAVRIKILVLIPIESILMKSHH